MTFAFSTKSLDWKTQYSFEPVHYANTKTELVSFSRSANDAGVWVHDEGTEYNKFYGTAYPSKLSVITNNNPSATKIYEAFSFEATKGGWSTKFTTETGEKQEGSVVPEYLVEKEGKFYSPVPKNQISIDAFVSLVGASKLGELGKRNMKLSGKAFSVPKVYFAFYFPPSTTELLLQVSGGQVTLDFINASQSLSNITTGKLFAIKNFGSGEAEMQVVTGPESAYEFPTSGITGQSWFSGYDPYSQSVTVSSQYSQSGIDLLKNAVGAFLGLTIDEMDILKEWPLYIYSISDFGLNGEDMRGEFMKIDIERSGTDYYELFAINVDQHQTKLDHSLGQNN